MKRILLNDTGQMTVFVALIFQVLFVFFAMVINIGLIVHDKINLQNAVDLGAYYGAERQAEILNEIAHVNYQIRQDYKLLAWRYRVLGTLGRGDADNPASFPPARTSANVIFQAQDVASGVPSVCVANLMWREFLEGSHEKENYCYREYGATEIPEIPNLPVLAPFVPGVLQAAITIGNLKNTQNLALMQSGPLNWAFAAQMMMAYKMALTSRKAVIQALRTNLVAPEFVDQTALPVSQGVLATIKKNLTVSNLGSFSDTDFKFINGLSDPNCAGAKGDGSPTISEIRTAPALLYTYPIKVGKNFGIQYTEQSDLTPLNPQAVQQFDPQGLLRYFAGDSPDATIGLDSPVGLNASSLGFEKNPWCMAYIGVRAKTSPRKPFAPFGKPVVLEARSFAQPFGGRIGPWYGQTWTPGAQFSGGDRVDPLTSSRLGGANAANASGETRLVNYSRFPGDTLGISAKASQAAERLLISSYSQNPNNLSYNYYLGFDQFPTHGDELAWDTTSADQSAPSGAITKLRQAEILAVAPDLFDITYYSIDPYYATNYKQLSVAGNRFPNLGSMFGKPITVPPDIGGRNGIAGYDAYGIKEQINAVNNGSETGIDPALKSAGLLNYYVASIDHLLTAWAPAGAQLFGFPDAVFGKCTSPASPKTMIPGGCAAGGRVGYSVRIISKDHLLSNTWAVGGNGVAPAGLINKPALDF